MEDKERRAVEARRLLEEPLLKEALDEIERATVEDMLRLPIWSDRKRRILTDRIRVIRGIRDHLKSVILTGDQKAQSRLTVV